jgi:hypothetical protein
MRERSEGTSVNFLQNDEFRLGKVRFLGACMWTDYGLFPLRFNDSLELARHKMSDHRLIRRRSDGAKFQPEDALAHQRETLLWLRESLDVPFDGKTVVVTHHLPSALSVRPESRGHELAPAYASNLELLAIRADVWIHGHAHWSVDYRIGRCRVVCNPRGRPGRNRMHPEVAYENASFNSSLTIDV